MLYTIAMTDLFPRFAAAIRTANLAAIDRHSLIPTAFLLEQDAPYGVNYIPFEAVNRTARVVVVGLTPGFIQWRNGVAEAQRQLLAGATQAEVLLAAKRFGAFSGPLRPNLVALLDAIGLHEWLEVPSCAILFGTRPDLLHSTSLLRHPVSRNGDNYSGTPAPIGHPFLRGQIEQYFAQEAAEFARAIFVPLGPAVADGLRWLASAGGAVAGADSRRLAAPVRRQRGTDRLFPRPQGAQHAVVAHRSRPPRPGAAGADPQGRPAACTMKALLYAALGFIVVTIVAWGGLFAWAFIFLERSDSYWDRTSGAADTFFLGWLLSGTAAAMIAARLSRLASANRAR